MAGEVGEKGLGLVDILTLKKMLMDTRSDMDIRKSQVSFLRACFLLKKVIEDNFDRTSRWFSIHQAHEAHFVVALYQDLLDRSMNGQSLPEPECTIWSKFKEILMEQNMETYSGAIQNVIQGLEKGKVAQWDKMIIDGEASFSSLEIGLISRLSRTVDISIITWRDKFKENLLVRDIPGSEMIKGMSGERKDPQVELSVFPTSRQEITACSNSIKESIMAKGKSPILVVPPGISPGKLSDSLWEHGVKVTPHGGVAISQTQVLKTLNAAVAAALSGKVDDLVVFLRSPLVNVKREQEGSPGGDQRKFLNPFEIEDRANRSGLTYFYDEESNINPGFLKIYKKAEERKQKKDPNYKPKEIEPLLQPLSELRTANTMPSFIEAIRRIIENFGMFKKLGRHSGPGRLEPFLREGIREEISASYQLLDLLVELEEEGDKWKGDAFQANSWFQKMQTFPFVRVKRNLKDQIPIIRAEEIRYFPSTERAFFIIGLNEGAYFSPKKRYSVISPKKEFSQDEDDQVKRSIFNSLKHPEKIIASYSSNAGGNPVSPSMLIADAWGKEALPGGLSGMRLSKRSVIENYGRQLGRPGKASNREIAAALKLSSIDTNVILRGLSSELGRSFRRSFTAALSDERISPFTAMLPDQNILKKDHVFSASSLERFRSCPFQFYINYVLDLGSKYQYQENLTKGTIVHKALKNAFDIEAEKENAFSRESRDRLLDTIEGELTREFNRAKDPKRTLWLSKGSFLFFDKRSGEWKGPIVQMVDDMLEKNIKPILFEYQFGGDKEKPLDMGTYYLTGAIDRVDEMHSWTQGEEGTELHPPSSHQILDYKSGNIPDAKKVASMEKIQGPLYSRVFDKLVKEGSIEIPGDRYDGNPTFTYYSLKPGDPGENEYFENIVKAVREELWKFALVENGLPDNKGTKKAFLAFLASAVSDKQLFDLYLIWLEHNIQHWVEMIRMGRLTPSPLNNKSCEYCDLESLCRKWVMPAIDDIGQVIQPPRDDLMTFLGEAGLDEELVTKLRGWA